MLLAVSIVLVPSRVRITTSPRLLRTSRSLCSREVTRDQRRSGSASPAFSLSFLSGLNLTTPRAWCLAWQRHLACVSERLEQSASSQPVRLANPGLHHHQGAVSSMHHMSMQMTFEASTSATLWFSSWHFMGWSYWGSCVGLFLFCLLHEFLTTYRSKVKQALTLQSSKQNGAASQQGSNTEQLLPRQAISATRLLFRL